MRLLLLLLCLLAACCPKPPVSSETVTRTTYVLKDTTVIKPGQPYVQHHFQITADCEEIGKGKGKVRPLATAYRNGKVAVTLAASDSTLTIGTASDPCAVTLQQARKEWEKERVQVQTVTVEKPVPYVPLWAWLTLAGAALWTFRRPLLKILLSLIKPI